MKLLDYYEEEDFGYTFFVNVCQWRKFAFFEVEAAWDDFPSWIPALKLYILGNSGAFTSVFAGFGRFRIRVRFMSYQAKNLTKLRQNSIAWPYYR